MRLVTPVTSPCLPDLARLEAARAMARRKRRVRALVLGGLFLVMAGLLGALASGCAPVRPAAAVSAPAAPRSPEILVLSERVGSTVADLIEAATGQHPFAVAAPGLPIIVFSPKDANDPGLVAHEMVHVRQQADMGPLRWSAVYVRDLLACEASGVSRAICLKTIPLEAEAYWVQRGGGP